MSKGQTKTDNSFLDHKVILRKHFLQDTNEDLMVLEMYAGNGVIWSNLQQILKNKITIVKIDKKNESSKIHLIGNNTKFIKSMDLSIFNVIDIDAYGIPFEQIDHVLKSNFKGHIFVTFIQSVMGNLPLDFLGKLGYTKTMVKKIPTLFSKNSKDKLKKVLSLYGIETIYTISASERKHYIYFYKDDKDGQDEHNMD